MFSLPSVSRRLWLRSVAAGACAGASGWLPALAERAALDPRRRRHCVLLWMSGGPSQTDTFDMKSGHANGGEFKEIATAVPGLRFSEHLPKLAERADRLAVVRSLSTKEGDHARGTYLMRTGQAPMGRLEYPAIGASLGMQLADPESAVPSYVSIAPFRSLNEAAFGPGFLGPRYAPLTVGAADGMSAPATGRNGFAELRVDDLAPPAGVTEARRRDRLELFDMLQDRFAANRPGRAVAAHRMTYDAALRLMNSDAARAFDLSEEPDAVRERYGKGAFGQGCLMARRWIERGAPFVEVSLGGGAGWDTHADNFTRVKELSAELDAGWATLMAELDDRGLLDSTTILWMGEFGRTPRINPGGGRDHYPRAWSCVLAGGGIKGGGAYGRTTDDGATVAADQVGVGEVLATLCAALGVPPETPLTTPSGRPIPIVDAAPIAALLA